MVDVWDWTFRRLKIAGLLGKVDCPCCQHRKFEWLDGALGSHTTTLCGRNAVQVATRRPEPLDFPELARRLAAAGRGPAQRLHAPVRHRGARVHRLPRRPGDHQGDERHRQGADALRPVRGKLTLLDRLDAIESTMIYLDNAATSFPKPEPVYQALDRFARTQPGQPGPGGAPDGRWRPSGRSTTPGTRSTSSSTAKAPERWIFTLNCTDGLNMAIKGTVEPGDHVITTDLEHNSISRPLRALEKAGVITLTRLASRRRLPRPRRRPPGAHARRRRWSRMTHASNVLGTVQPIEAIARDRPRGRRPVPGRRGAVGRRRADRPAGHADRPARLPRPQGPLRPDRHRRPLRRPARQARAPGAKGAPAATRRARPSPSSLPYFLEGGTPNVLGVAGLAAGIAWVAERGPESQPAPRGRPAPAASSTGPRPPTAGRSPAAGTPPRTSAPSR